MIDFKLFFIYELFYNRQFLKYFNLIIYFIDVLKDYFVNLFIRNINHNYFYLIYCFL